MSKTAEELATEIVSALIANDKSVAWMQAEPATMGRNVTTVWKTVFAAIYNARTDVNQGRS